MYLNCSNFRGRTSAGGGGEQALVQKQGQVSDGGIGKIFAGWGDLPVPPGKKPCLEDHIEDENEEKLRKLGENSRRMRKCSSLAHPRSGYTLGATFMNLVHYLSYFEFEYIFPVNFYYSMD